jgi:hypothetical protein
MPFGVVHVCIATGLEAWCDCSAPHGPRKETREIINVSERKSNSSSAPAQQDPKDALQFDQIESIEENGFVVQPTKSLDLS